MIILGIPEKIEQNVIDTWYPKEPRYPRRTRPATTRPKIEQVNYMLTMEKMRRWSKTNTGPKPKYEPIY